MLRLRRRLQRGRRNPVESIYSLALRCRDFQILAVVSLGFLFLAHGAASTEVPAAMVQMPDAAPPGVVWIVQLSDIHISKWTPSRGRALRRAAGRALKVIQPGVILVSGDLTDAKSKDMKTTQQEEVEWMEYSNSFRDIANESGIPLQNFFDLRGNHDKYGVPLQSPLDYYSKYSITAAMNRSGSLVQSVTVQGRDGRKNFFVGFDDSMQVGLRGPSNLFGHSTDEILDQLDQELKRWDDDNNVTPDPVTKIVYGHFPMSFTTSSETGKRVEDVMASNGVSAYVCGHLHTTFGHRLYKHHKEHSGDFWEWEMGDWRLSRMMRVMAIDHGYTSFVDIELIPPSDSAEGEFAMPTIILQTYPLDSTFMLQISQKGETLNSIRAFVFSETTPAGVEARIYDSRSKTLANVTLMKSLNEGIDHGAHYYTAFWDWERYVHQNCAIEIVARSKDGRSSYSQMRSVSVTGHPEPFRPTALVFLILYVKWERLVPVAVWGPVIVLITLLVAAMLSLWWKNDKYEQWAESVFVSSATWKGVLVKALKGPFVGLVELYSRNFLLWGLVLVYVVYLAIFPWFWARCLADDYPMGRMSLHGWTVKPSNVGSVPIVSGLGVPDIVVIAMTYFCGVLIPVLLVISVLSAERAGYEFSSLGKCLKCSKASNISEADRLLGSENDQCPLPRSHFTGKARKGLFVLCLLILSILGQCCLMIGRAYGFSALATAPVYAWGFPPVLLLLSFHQTSRTSCRCSLKQGFQKGELPKRR